VSTRRRILMFLFELLLLFLILPSHGLEAAQRTGTQAPSAPGLSEGARLTVYVRDENGSSFSGLAMVTLQHLTSQTLSTGPTTGGRAIFDELGPGEYTAVVDAPGYLAASERVNITLPNQQEQVIVTLKRDNDSLMASAPAGPPMLSPKLQKELSRAVEALHANNLDAAQKRLDAAYRLAPSNPEVNYLRGLLADRQETSHLPKPVGKRPLAWTPNTTLHCWALPRSSPAARISPEPRAILSVFCRATRIRGTPTNCCPLFVFVSATIRRPLLTRSAV